MLCPSPSNPFQKPRSRDLDLLITLLPPTTISHHYYLLRTTDFLHPSALSHHHHHHLPTPTRPRTPSFIFRKCDTVSAPSYKQSCWLTAAPSARPLSSTRTNRASFLSRYVFSVEAERTEWDKKGREQGGECRQGFHAAAVSVQNAMTDTHSSSHHPQPTHMHTHRSTPARNKRRRRPAPSRHNKPSSRASRRSNKSGVDERVRACLFCLNVYRGQGMREARKRVSCADTAPIIHTSYL